MSEIKKILVPLDGSENSQRALNEGILLARLSNAELTGIYVIHSDSSSESFVDMLKPLSTIDEKGFAGKQLAEANVIMDEAKKECQKQNISFDGIAAIGKPGIKIVEFAENKNFDLIVIGMTGKGHTGELLLGSVSYHVIHNAKMPVVVVK